MKVGDLIKPIDPPIPEWEKSLGLIFVDKHGELKIYWNDCGSEQLALYDDSEVGGLFSRKILVHFPPVYQMKSYGDFSATFWLWCYHRGAINESQLIMVDTRQTGLVIKIEKGCKSLL